MLVAIASTASSLSARSGSSGRLGGNGRAVVAEPTGLVAHLAPGGGAPGHLLVSVARRLLVFAQPGRKYLPFSIRRCSSKAWRSPGLAQHHICSGNASLAASSKPLSPACAQGLCKLGLTDSSVPRGWHGPRCLGLLGPALTSPVGTGAGLWGDSHRLWEEVPRVVRYRAV